MPIRIGEGATHSERLRPFLAVSVGLGWEYGAEVEFFRSAGTYFSISDLLFAKYSGVCNDLRGSLDTPFSSTAELVV